MNTSNYCIPFVGAIIERKNNDGQIELLIQTRMQAGVKSIYNGTLEFAAGGLDKLYENVYEALAREIKEETGTDLIEVIDDSQTAPVSLQNSDSVFGFRPYVCVQQLAEGRPWVGFIFRCRVSGTPQAQESETRDVHWVLAKDFYKIYRDTPEKIFSLEYPAWQYYFKEQEV